MLGVIPCLVCSRRTLLLENLALRQQLVVLKRRHPRPRLSSFARLFWIVARRFWSGWMPMLIIVTPETVTRWHRAGFRLYWRFTSRVRKRAGRRQISRELRDLIFRMDTENPTWGAPRIQGELLMLGFDVSERTVSRWTKRAIVTKNVIRRQVSPGMPRGYLLVVRAAHRPSRRRLRYRRSWHRVL